MWSFKKKKGATLPPGGSIEIEFATAWRPDKREVVVMTERGPITLNEKSEFFIELTGDNIEPLRIRVTPDFKNRKLDFVEIIDPNIKSKDIENKGRVTFTGANMSKDMPISIDKYLKRWDENIEKTGNTIKKYERRKYIFTALGIIMILFSTYALIIGNGSLRYINLLAITITGYTIYRLWGLNRKLCKDYDEYKKLREESFGVVKEK